MKKIAIIASMLTLTQTISSMESNINNAQQITNQKPITLIGKEGVPFKLHKELANKSTVLKTILANAMKEAKTSKINLPSIDTNTLATIQLLLQVGETQRTNILQVLVSKKNSNEIQSLTNAAHYLNIDELLKTKSRLPIIQEICSNVLSVIEIPCKELLGHKNVVKKIITDDDYLISGSGDGSIRIWNKKTGQCLHELTHHLREITILVNDGDYLIAGCDLGSICVWNKHSGKLLHELYGHTFGISGLMIDHDLLISSSVDKTIRIWNKNTGKCLHILKGHESTVELFKIHDDYIFSASRDGIRKWNKHTGECIIVQGGYSGFYPYWRKTAEYGKYYFESYAGSPISVSIWRNEKEEFIRSLGSNINKIISALLLDEDYLVSGYENGTICTWDLSTFKEFESFIEDELPIAYAKLLYLFDTRAGDKYSKLVQLFTKTDNYIHEHKEILNHFLETIETNWGSKVMEKVKETLMNSVTLKQKTLINEFLELLPHRGKLIDYTFLGTACTATLLGLVMLTKK